VARRLRNDKRELRLKQNCELLRQRQHSGVGRDQPVPWPVVRVQRKQDLPVVELGHARIDPLKRNKLRFHEERRNDVHDRLREVVIERELAWRHGSTPRNPDSG